MIITFLGTRGYIDIKSRLHKRHASTLIEYKKTRIMIDCGIDWQKKVWHINPHAIIITHAHPDHAWGLKDGSPCPVYATQASWQIMNKYPIAQKNSIYDRVPFKIGNFSIEPFFVVHSIRAPAVGYRIRAGKKTIFVAHDIVYIPQRAAALKNIQLYIGDGATITRPMIRKKDGVLFGHSSIKTQIGWCKKEKVPRAIFTHCGTQIVKADGRTIQAKVKQMGKMKEVTSIVAFDGLKIAL
jgi:phosphoribosyl 1,2-cyclic phosphodiesterase